MEEGSILVVLAVAVCSRFKSVNCRRGLSLL